LIALVVYARRKKYSPLTLADMCALPLLIGQAFGRLGCFSAGCCYGKPTASIFGVTFRHENSLAPLFMPLHPTQLYEFAGDMVLFFVGYELLKKYPAGRGKLTAFYLIGYGALRFLIEFLRGDDRGFRLQNLYPSQWIALLSIFSGIIVFLALKGKKHA
jgi:phosphatidylglycerol:prolipoprotein diacylglycerol transferase